MPWSPVGGGRSLKGGKLEAVAKAHGASVYQVAIAWLLQRSPVMLPIPGTSSVAHLEENVAAGKLSLTAAEVKSLDGLAR
jgi:aryl-alcohol dehydrogenase-like predicted oxidoreductase